LTFAIYDYLTIIHNKKEKVNRMFLKKSGKLSVDGDKMRRKLQKTKKFL